jgi:hypothetical protein
MSNHKPDVLPIATRVYPQPRSVEKRSRSDRPWRCPKAMLVFDTETRTDATQRLLFGSYRFIVRGQCVEEGLFYADDLSENERRILEKYVKMHRPEVVDEGFQQLRLLTLREFVDRLYRAAYKGRCLLVGFNLPFDLSRIAHDFTKARGRFVGGFSLGLWSFIDKAGRERANPHRPRIGIKQIDSKRALKGFTGRKSPDGPDLIPEGSKTGKPEQGYKFRGHFLDLRTLAFALTDRGYSLETACEAFGVEHGKQRAKQHGRITEEYIDYNRRDVLATFELAGKLLEEYAKHPISLQATKAFSGASIGKAYLREMGITPVLERQPGFSKEYLGFAESAFFGGRTSAHIRKVSVPVVYTDFLSMYPTVNSLMGLWRLVTADEIKGVKDCKKEIERFLKRLAASDLFNPKTWKHLTAFVKIIPDGDILPCRSKYGAGANDWQIGVNYLYPESNNDNGALWYSLPDIVASVLLTGKIPKIVDAFRLVAHGQASELVPVKLRGTIEVDPKSQDFFKVAIEERKRLSSRTYLSNTEKNRLDKALKLLANAASYGIYAEMNRQESEERVIMTCHGIDAEPYTCFVAHPEVPAEYCFPPLASLITGAARLMLALLEHCVSELGGTYAMEDTDSMAIVATERGGLIPCPGGPYRTKQGRSAIKALSWEHVRDISKRFAALNPYDRDAIPGSVLKIEDDNFDPQTKKQRQIYCLAISAKRYALFSLQNGVPVIIKNSEHGLGHLLNPSDPESTNRDWIAQTWLNIVCKSLGLPARHLGFENSLAVGRVTVSSPAVMQALNGLNDGKSYPDQIKPFNFLLACQVSPFGHPVGVDPAHFHLIAPYESDPRKWPKLKWIDQYTGKKYRITTAGNNGTRLTARVKTYGDILREYEYHPESKCAGADGKPSGKQAVGLLQRRHVRIDLIRYIGKESNFLEDVESGMLHSEEDAYTEYPDLRRDEWETKVRPALQKIPLSLLQKKSGLSRMMLFNARTGRTRPHRKNRELLARIVQGFGPMDS